MDLGGRFYERLYFCKIAGGEIPSITLFEDDKVKVIFDAGPATVGHALVIPKSHAANVLRLTMNFWLTLT